MNKPLRDRLLIFVLAGVLSGCAAVREYARCGYQGCPEDAGISAKVRTLISEHPALGPPNQIYVQTLDRVVYLSGQVATGLQRAAAESVAGGAAGVRKVVDNISLTYTGR